MFVMFRTTSGFIFIFALTLQTLYAEHPAKYPGYEEKHFQSLRYGLFKPVRYDKSKSYPLVVYLHGSRDTVSRDLVWYQQSVQKDNPVFVLLSRSVKIRTRVGAIPGSKDILQLPR